MKKFLVTTIMTFVIMVTLCAPVWAQNNNLGVVADEVAVGGIVSVAVDTMAMVVSGKIDDASVVRREEKEREAFVLNTFKVTQVNWTCSSAAAACQEVAENVCGGAVTRISWECWSFFWPILIKGEGWYQCSGGSSGNDGPPAEPE
jgi:hypothetical protein